MILVNVLAMVAVAAALVTAMLGREGPALDRATAFAEAGRALAIARGGELTVVTALRRDLAGDRPDPAAALRGVAQPTTPIAGGTFGLTITDAQARFNVNAAAGAGEPAFAAITAALGLHPDVAERIAASVAARPVRDLGDLAAAGIDDATLARLRTLVTALPGDAPVNLSAAPPALLAALIGDPAAAHLLADRRARSGRLTALDFIAAGVAVPAGAGFVSDHYVAAATVRQGATTVTLTSLVERRHRPDTAVVVARWLGPPS